MPERQNREEARPSEHLRYSDQISIPTAQMLMARDMVDAVLRDVFQGKRDNLRDHMLAVAYKVAREHPWPYFEECVAAEVAARVTTAKVEALREAAADLDVGSHNGAVLSAMQGPFPIKEWRQASSWLASRSEQMRQEHELSGPSSTRSGPRLGADND